MVIRKEDNSDLMAMSPSSSRNALIKALKKSSDKFEDFRTRWYEEYLLSLRETCRDLYQTRWDNLVKVDDVVLIRSPIKDRPFWQMGIVTKLMHGDDGKVRSVFVKTPGGQISLYPVKILYPLELSLTHSGSSQPSSASTGSMPLSVVSSTPGTSAQPTTSISRHSMRNSGTVRPVRKAAVTARVHFREEDSDSESEYKVIKSRVVSMFIKNVSTNHLLFSFDDSTQKGWSHPSPWNILKL